MYAVLLLIWLWHLCVQLIVDSNIPYKNTSVEQDIVGCRMLHVICLSNIVRAVGSGDYQLPPVSIGSRGPP